MSTENGSHLALGAHILAVVQTLRAPEALLGEEWLARQRHIHPRGWYPVSVLLELLNQLHRRVDREGLVALGRQLFRDAHQRRLTPYLRSAGDVVFSLNGMYHHAHRGKDIGGWEVLLFSPGRAVLRKTTPHPCALEEGVLCEALHCVGVEAEVRQAACVQHGARACDFEIRSPVRGERWSGTHAPI